MEYEWDPGKAKEVEEKHGISFDEVVHLIGRGFLWKIVNNPSRKHKGQKAFLVCRERSIFMVPFENREHKCRLISAFYSKFFSEQYRRIENGQD